MPRRPALAIRVARRDDVDAVTTLRLALRREEQEVSVDAMDQDDAALRSRTHRQLGTVTQAFFLAEHRGEAVGVLRAALSPADHGVPQAMLTTAYVAPGYRRRGVMRQLVAAAETWCRDRGVRELRLRNYQANGGAGSTWESLGFGVVQVVRRRVLKP